MEKSAKRTLICTVRPRSPCRRSRQPTCSARSTAHARSTSMSAMSCSKVVSLEIDLASRSGTTGRSSRPCARFHRCSPHGAEAALQRVQRPLPKLADGADAQPLENLAALLAHSPQSLDWQRIEKRLHTVWLDDNQGVRLLQVAGDLGQELVGGYAY